MSNTGKEIGELLNTSGAAAPDITKPLKPIGGGNMLDGVKKFLTMHLQKGKRQALLQGRKED